MVITELYIRNFGKLSERHFYLRDGVQVISGENEYGKTTLHAFIRAMLFGLERGRGRAAAKDDFSRYEPWDDPGSYAGVMRFTCGGRSFRLERNFARQTKQVSLVCEDDGEELSVEHGDLQMLLGGMTAELFDNTVSVGQLKAAPGQELSDALANYAANYYETGGGEYDLSKALKSLDEKKRAVRRELRDEEAAGETERKKLLQKSRYLEEDIRRLDAEYKEIEKTLRELPGPERTDVHGKNRFIIGGIAAICAGVLLLLWSLWSGHESGRGLSAVSVLTALVPVLAAVAGVFLLAAGYAGKFRSHRNRSEADEQRRWELERIRSEIREKEIRRENIREQYEESEKSDSQIRLEEQCRALELAVEELQKAAQVTAGSMERSMSRRASEIFSAITDGKYRSLETDRQRGITVWDGERKIPAGRLSRGTVEQIYFCIRMAAAEILTEEPLPLILDDVFAFYDDKRLESVLKWLSGQGKQVIIFTCHSREEELLRGLTVT
ncbi:ATP-binding protein [Mediterraneibacter glycyrrhizinilyticus]|uniref:ATP-binding protein n=1 Tax=Mediterraneibacter glycyrrhizinilyticus TaxID=342942 RepID=UPI0025A449DF|nr:AAA family ATPase [Mediterraneibacter glycyrrhizinilyticus]MDM8124014.1 AAA family ATPase [Mediterraneibacter glycyrrhizinilyticus]